MLKYKDRFKIEERQESLSQSNQQFKIKFKKQYLNKIFAQSVLKVNTGLPLGKRDDINQQNDNHTEEEYNDFKKRLQDTKQFIQQKNQAKSYYVDMIIPDDQTYHKEYNKGINQMKNNFSDYILDCVKKEVNSNFLLTFKQRDSLGNVRDSNTRLRSSTDIQSFRKISVIDEGERENIISKRGSIFSSRIMNKSRISVSSLSQSPTLVLRLSQEEPKSPSVTNFLNVHYFKQNGTSNRKESIELSINRKSTLLNSIEVIHERRKSNTLNLQTQKRKSNGSGQTRGSQGDMKSQFQEQNNKQENTTVTNEDNSKIQQEKEPESCSNLSVSSVSSQSVPVIIEPQKINQNFSQKQRASLFKDRKVTDFENLDQLPQLNPISEKLITTKSNKSSSISPKRQKVTQNYHLIKDNLIDEEIKELKEVQEVNEAKDNQELKKTKEAKDLTQSLAADKEKSLLIEGTWDLGLGNKSREIDLKKELVSRGLLKLDLQKPQIKNIFPALDKYKRGKIEQKIQKIKQQQDKINNHAANNIQVTTIKENNSQIFSSNRSIKISQNLAQQNSNNNLTLQSQELEQFQKQNPLVKIDQNNSQNLNKQYSLPVLSAKTIAVNPIDPPLFLPKIAKNTNPLFQIFPNHKYQKSGHMKTEGSYTPSTQFFKNINLVSSFIQTPQNNRSSNKSMNFCIGDIQSEFDVLKGFKCGSPISQKLNTIINSPQSSHKKSGQIFDFNQRENTNSAQDSNVNMDIQATSNKLTQDSVIQSPNNTSSHSDQFNYDKFFTSQSSSKKKDTDYIRPRQLTEQCQSMLQRINSQRPIIFQNVLNKEKKQQNNNVK